MISFDTNVALAIADPANPAHEQALSFLKMLRARTDVVLSELMLLELYGVLRNGAAVPNPLNEGAAIDACAAFRRNPRWQVVALPQNSRDFHDDLWNRLRQPGLARRRAYDLRLGLALRYHGVDEFATANVKDFEGLGFSRVWDPLGS